MKFLLGLVVTLVLVRVVFEGQCAVGLLDVSSLSVFLQVQNLVEVSTFVVYFRHARAG